MAIHYIVTPEFRSYFVCSSRGSDIRGCTSTTSCEIVKRPMRGNSGIACSVLLVIQQMGRLVRKYIFPTKVELAPCEILVFTAVLCRPMSFLGEVLHHSTHMSRAAWTDLSSTSRSVRDRQWSWRGASCSSCVR